MSHSCYNSVKSTASFSQEFTSSHWSLLWLWEPQHQCTLHVFCARRDDWWGWISSTRHTFHKDLEDTEYRFAANTNNNTQLNQTVSASVMLTPDLSVWFSGAESWPPGVCLKYVGGDQFGHVNMVMVRSLDPQEMTDVSVQMQSPTSPGMYQGQWRMCTATGLYYGGRF